MIRFDLLSDPEQLPFLIPAEDLAGVLPAHHLSVPASGRGALPAAAEEWIVRRLGSISATTAERGAEQRWGRPTTGPVPVNWSGTVTRSSDVPAFTYALRYEGRFIWKIGHAQDVDDRLEEVHRHVPFEELHERWILALTHSWSDSSLAHRMEQEVLRLLSGLRTEGERVRCTPATLEEAWASACLSVLKG